MATVHRLPEIPVQSDGILTSLSRLAALELELGLAEARALLVGVAITAAVALTAAIALVASLVVLVAAAFAPLFSAPWQHLVVAGGGVALLAIVLIAWCALRAKRLPWPRRTLHSLEETWRWLGVQLKSRLT